MDILIASDLHLEFSDIVLDAAGAGVVVLAGDIHLGAAGVEWAKARFAQPVIYVAGNHEYYKGEIGAVDHAIRTAAAGSNVHVLDQGAVTIEGVRFLGAVLWTDFDVFGPAVGAQAVAECLAAMPDFSIVRHGAATLTPQDTIDFHADDRAWLEASLATPHDGPTVVVTHHAPHKGSIAPQFADDPVTAAFISDLEPLILEAAPALWIHGHTHTGFDYRVGATRIVCNPRGYARTPNAHKENTDFGAGFRVTV